MTTSNEAGPSTRPIPITPENAKTRRRSWFNLGSPSLLSPSPTSKDKKGKRGSVGGDELELGDVGSMRKASVGSLRGENSPTRSTTAKPESVLLPVDSEELLTIDGEVETIKKKKKRRSKADQDDEALRMEDFSPRSGTLRGGLVEDIGGSSPSSFPSFSIRQFSRTASDRLTIPIPSGIDPIEPTPRSSSLSHPSTLAPIVGKSQPPTPTERPLPPLPDAAVGEPPPPIPREIVITPSSPLKLRTPDAPKPKRQSSRGSQSQPRREGSRSNSRPRSAGNSTPKGLSLGLGLPFSRRRESKEDSDSPPPLPVKQQVVSSPLPSRSASPVGYIKFADDIDVKNERGRPQNRQVQQKEKVVKRARSLSGLFGGKPALLDPSAIDSEGTTLDAGETSAAGATKSGMFEWLSVKKSGKRRPSDGKSGHEADSEVFDIRALEKERTSRDASRSASRNGSIVDLSSGYNSDRRRSDDVPATIIPRRPQLRNDTSSTTVVPATGSMLSNLFSRRSTKAAELPGNNTLPLSERLSPLHQPHHVSSASSQSSLVLPPVAAQSPFYIANPAEWASTPTSENEETIFNPGSGGHWGPGVRPWMDSAAGPRSSSRSALASPLESLPEQGPILEQPVATVQQERRLRSLSDAPRPIPGTTTNTSSHPHLTAGQSATSLASLGSSSQMSSASHSRPTMGYRSNSGNSAILVRVKSVFKSTSRNRSSSLLQQPDDGVNEFGTSSTGDDWLTATRMRPSSSSSSSVASPGPGRSRLDDGVNNSLLGLTDPRRIFLNDAQESSSRPHYTASVSSHATGSTRHSTAPGYTSDHPSAPKALGGGAKSRARASTIANGPSSYHPLPPMSPNIYPAAATPPRKRPGSIRRLSNGIFGAVSISSSPKSSSLFPLPPRSSGSISSSTGYAQPWEDGASISQSYGASPRPSTGSFTQGQMTSASIKAAAPKEAEGETPENWLERISRISRSEIANVLAASGDKFHTDALRIYMSRFDFTHNALDIALRKLLMHMSLPRETQQIDRIIEAFAVRYEECEPGMFVHKDRTYVLAFSMMMLHTDAFNRNNKNKMSKADYVRNTRMEGVPPLVLEAFFDNITYTPFVFIEDDNDFSRTNTDSFSSTPIMTTSIMPTKTSKLDIYHLIVRDQIQSLRVDVEKDIPADSPISCLGTRAILDIDGLHRAFVRSYTLPIVVGRPRRKSSAGMLIKDNGHPDKQRSEMDLKVTKAGLLSRKDDVNDGGKKSTSRKWKSWSVILTGSQLMFFKDQMWGLTLQEQIASNANDKPGQGQSLLPRMNYNPDEVFPLKDCIAFFDFEYAKYPNTFRFIMPQGRQYLMQASDEYEMNEWLTLINYASTFKTAGVRIRGDVMESSDAVMTGAAAAASHRRDVQLQHDGIRSMPISIGAPRKEDRHKFHSQSQTIPGSDVVTPDMTTLSAQSDSATSPPQDQVIRDISMVDLKDGLDSGYTDGDRVQEVFGIVKAELAAGRGGAEPILHLDKPNNGIVIDHRNTKPPRKETINESIQSFKKHAEKLQNDLSLNLLLARNMALLCPFQRSTRERIEIAVPPVAASIRDLRIQLAKYKLWIEVLQRDSERETREFARVRHVALQAANRSLRDPGGVRAVVKDVNEAEGGLPVPTLSLPASDDEYAASGSNNNSPRDDNENDSEVETADRFGTSPGELPVVIRRPSDDFERPPLNGSSSSDYLTVGNHLGSQSSSALPGDSPSVPIWSSPVDTSDALDASGQSTPVMFPINDDPDATIGNISMLASNGHTEEDSGTSSQFSTRTVQPSANASQGAMDAGAHGSNQEEEHSEDWRNTRAARRVSLANVAIPRGEMRRNLLRG